MSEFSDIESALSMVSITKERSRVMYRESEYLLMCISYLSLQFVSLPCFNLACHHTLLLHALQILHYLPHMPLHKYKPPTIRIGGQLADNRF